MTTLNYEIILQKAVEFLCIPGPQTILLLKVDILDE